MHDHILTVKQVLVLGNLGFLKLPADLSQLTLQGRWVIWGGGTSGSRGWHHHRRFPGSKTHGAADDPASKGLRGSSPGALVSSQEHRALGTFPSCQPVGTCTCR